MDDLVNSLPTLEELEKRGKPKLGRQLTKKEQAQATEDKKKKRKNLETKRLSEALCKRQFIAWGAHITKVRDDLVTLKDGMQVRVSKDVDFSGVFPLIVNGTLISVPLKVESKGITLKAGRKKHTGSFPLSSLSDKERKYMWDHRRSGGLSIVHLAWWYEKKCTKVHIVDWRTWLWLEKILQETALVDTRFKGKSLRYHADIVNIENCAVDKVGGRWEFSRNHWLAKLLPTNKEQLKLW